MDTPHHQSRATPIPPQGVWLCPRCVAKLGGRVAAAQPAGLPLFPCGSGGEEAWQMAERLGRVEYR